jgi:anti-anti-sigma factor
MAAHELAVSVNEDGAVATIDLSGEINSAAEAQLDGAYERAGGAGARTIVLDFTATEYINSSGIALIVGLLGQARGHGLEVQARGLSEHYREIFEITRLADFMTILDNENSAADGAEGKQHA